MSSQGCPIDQSGCSDRHNHAVTTVFSSISHTPSPQHPISHSADALGKADSIYPTRNRCNSVVQLRWRLTALLLCVGSAGWFAIASKTAAQDAHSPLTIAQIYPSGATVLYVNPSFGKDTPDAGKQGAPFRTITYALRQATPDTIVQLAAGSYTQQTGEVFPLSIPAGVTLQGDETSRGQTIAIIGGGEYVSATFARQSVTIRPENNSQVRGVSVTNPYVRGTGIWIESTNPKIQNCTFANNNREGIFITGTGNPVIEGSVFTKNGGNGISVAKQAKGEIRSNLFQNTGFGLAIGGNSTPLVTNNQILQNVDGIYINDSAHPILRNNVIENNNRDGIVATINAQPDLGTADSAGNNAIRNNRQYDLHNSTGNILYSVGNSLDTQRVAGRVEFVAPTGGQTAFQDIQGHWAQAYIDALAKRNIITGFPDGTFHPNDPVTRAQFAVIVSKALPVAAKQARTEFQDVSTQFWGYQAIQLASQAGFMRGYPGGLFKPNQAIPRVEALVSLTSGLSFSSTNLGILSKYQDANQIPSWATGAIAAATERRVVVNYPTVTLLNPNQNATRADVAAFVYQALVNTGKASAIPSPYVVLVP